VASAAAVNAVFIATLSTAKGRGLLFLVLVAACGGAPAAQSSSPPPARLPADSTSATLVPPNLGSLRQEDVSIVLQPLGIRATLIPLDESIIRVLAPDSYRSLQSIRESRRAQIVQRAQMHGARNPSVWYVTFYGLTPNARFIPTDLTITSAGRDFRPFDIITLTDNFGAQRLQQREIARGLLLFEDGVDVNLPLVVSIGAERNVDWSNEAILGAIDTERTRIRARAGRTNP
jgi:hypothetical protein